MLSDSLSSGKKVYIVPIKKIKTKIKNFTKIILEKKWLNYSMVSLKIGNIKSFCETNKVCKKLIKVLNL